MFGAASTSGLVPGELRGGCSRFLLALASVLFASIFSITSALAQIDNTSKSGPNYKPGELLVKYRSAASAHSSMVRQGALIASTIKTHPSIGVRRVKLTEGTDVKRALEALRKDPDVDYAEPNYRYQASVVPNDPSFSQQWGLAAIHAPEAWGITSGTTTVVVAVVDTGVCYTHPDLAQNIWSNRGEIAGNGTDDDGNGKVDDDKGWDFVNEDNDPMDLNGHGTHVAGIIAAVGNNATGICGVSWSTKIMPVRGLDASGSGYTSDLIECIEYASANGAHVINCSWGGGGYSQFLKDAICASPALVVCAAGNDSANNDSTPSYPANYSCPNLISVAATDSSDNLASFSNYGAASVDVGAPGVSILSTYLSSPYTRMSGTSMATPHVSGIAALVKGQSPSMTGVQMKEAIWNSVDKVGSLSGKLITGGRVNALNALPPAAPTSLYISKILADKIYLAWTDNAANETGFRIERKAGSGGGWSQIATTAANVTTYTDSWEGDLDFHYRVLAYNMVASSSYSNTAVIDTSPTTASLTYSAPELDHVDMGTLVITATSSKTLVGAPAISVKRPGAMSTITGSMSGVGTVWTYSLNISRYNGASVLDGLYTVSLDAKDLLGNSLGEVRNTKFITDTKDFDNDGIRDYDDPDDDNDGLPDEWEIRYGLNPQDAAGVNGWGGDFDNDGWANGEEYQNGTSPSNPASRPAPAPPVILEINPRDNSGVSNTVRIPNNTAFAVRFEAPHKMALSSGVTLFVNDGVTAYSRRLSDTNSSGVTLVQAVPLDTGNTQSGKLWVVYYRANETEIPSVYPFEATVGISVYATDIRRDSMVPARFGFKIEGLTDYVKSSENSPETRITSASGVTKVEVDRGILQGAAILYDDSVEKTGVTPYFGPSDEIPALNISGANGVGAPMNLQPPMVFPDGVTLQIPAPGYNDVSGLCVYYYNGESWVLACNGAGAAQPGGEGWMIPGSRVNHNNGSPSTIEIRVYHFSGALAGSAPPTGGGGGDGGGGGGGDGGGSGLDSGGTGSGGSGGGGGCFIRTLTSGS